MRHLDADAALVALDAVIARALKPSRTLLVVPPFAAIELPSIALHLLQACAARAGHQVDVFYANLAFAALIGEDFYEALSDGPGLPGERMFAHAAFGKPLTTLFPEADTYRSGQPVRSVPPVPAADMRRFAVLAARFSDLIADRIAAMDYDVVGCSTTFEQTTASVALLDRLKARAPATVTMLGGANCEGPMGDAMAVLVSSADHIFSGEAERTFPAFLTARAEGRAGGDRIVRATAAADMGDLPLPQFDQYFTQLALFLPDGVGANLGETWLPYESSRGCWWGEKSQCTFCGLNGSNIVQRSKSSDTVFEEMTFLSRRYPTPNIFAVDNIMPRPFFKNLLPRLAEVDGINLFYEQKSNLSFDDLAALKRAGVNLIQPGIESLSTPLLKLMRKGVTARQHIRLLRDARAIGIALNWNLLSDFPGDQPEYYADMLALIPHLVHFNAPLRLLKLSLDRFSPYFEAPGDHGIANLRPKPAYAEILPNDAPVEAIAYHFLGDYQSAARSHPALLAALDDEVERWKSLWAAGRPAPILSVAAVNDDMFMLVDSRYPGGTRYEFLDAATHDLLMTERRVGDVDPAAYRWPLERHYVCEVDGCYVPLAIAGVAGAALTEPAREVDPVPVVVAA